MSSNFTTYDLEHVTDYMGFESFCQDLMSREGYKDIEPLGGFADKGRDAIHTCFVSGKVTIFTYSVREDWKKKLNEDLKKVKVHGHSCDNICFVTTSSLTASEKDQAKANVKSNYGWQLEIFDLERIRILVDNHYQDLKASHANIFTLSSRLGGLKETDGPLDRTNYATYLISAHKEWFEKYTPLLAEYREIETLVVPTSSTNADDKGIAVAKIPELSHVAVLLGESGSGKTTALWKIIVESSKSLLKDDSARVPILVNLRGWSDDCRIRDLVQNEFSLVGASNKSIEEELSSGNCLILIDGLNELLPNDALRREAYKDMQRFLTAYPKNRFVICCRTSDYTPKLLDLDQLKPKISEPQVYEIKRLERDQVIDYINKYFKSKADEAQKLLDKLDIENASKWRDRNSILNLARIPLYLQLIITEFKQSGHLPNSRSKLLRILVLKIMEREEVRNAARVDRFAKESLLASIAYQAIHLGYLLRLPDYVAQTIVSQEVQKLKERGMISAELTFGAIYQELLSNNFLKAADWKSIEWIHQLVMDYFLACAIVSIRSEDNADNIRLLNQQIKKQTQAWQQACIIAMGLLDQGHGAKFLEDLLTIDTETARLAFESLDQSEAADIAGLIIDKMLAEEYYEDEMAPKLSLMLPYPPVVETFKKRFRFSGEADRVKIAEEISFMIMKYYSLVVSGKPVDPVLRYELESELSSIDKLQVCKAVKDGIDLLNAWINNKYEGVQFHAAKGLWESDKGSAANALKGLLSKGNAEIAAKVRELMEQWGIQ